ncbi:transposase [Streptomyces sp. NPDC056549]|uniref:transposase n=1 Tax=Streptomyces sp. NPDC056549 TaxID=3345864 RepID=UPI00369CF910
MGPEQYPAAELVALYRERWETELAFDEIKNHLGPGGPIRSRTPEGVCQELWACLAVHHAIRQFAHTAALACPAMDADRVSYLRCVRTIPSHSVRPLPSSPPPLLRPG